MKRLEELGISPAPWTAVPYGESTESKQPTVGDVVDATGESLVLDMPTYKDARLIAAAPKLYQALYKITKEQECGRDCSKCKNDGCVIQECRAALAEAAGEEVDDGREG